MRKAASAALAKVLPREEATELARQAEIRVLAGQLRHGETKHREAAAAALGATGEVQAVEPLLAVLNQHEEWSVTQAAARALAKLGDAGIDALIAVLRESNRWREFHDPYHNWSNQFSSDRYDTVRAHAAASLSESKAVRARGDARARAVEAIATALVGRGLGSMRDALTRVLMKLGYTASAVARLEQEASRARFPRGEAGPESATIVEHPAELEIEDKTRGVETESVPGLLALLGEAFGTNARKAADKITRTLEKAGPTDLAALAAGIRDDNAMVRWTVAQMLGKIGGPDVLPALHAALDDPDEGVREAASVAIERIGSR